MQKFSSAIVLYLILVFLSNANAAPDKIKIIILGDSLSAAHNIAVKQSWPHLFRLNMRSKFPQTSVINASISGETTYGGLQRLPKLLRENEPTHLIIELGGNDGLRGMSLPQTTDNLRQMVNLAQQQNITVLMIGVRMPPNFGLAYNQRFQGIFETVVSETGINYLAKFLEGVAASDPALMQSDRIHPTALAQPILAKKVEQQMTAILNQ